MNLELNLPKKLGNSLIRPSHNPDLHLAELAKTRWRSDRSLVYVLPGVKAASELVLPVVAWMELRGLTLGQMLRRRLVLDLSIGIGT